MHVLVAAASREGSTLEIAEAIAGALRVQGMSVTVATPSAVEDVRPFDAAIIGSAVYAGRWLGPAVDLVHRQGDELRSRDVWLFSSGPIGDPKRAVVRRMSADPQELPELLELSGAHEHRSFGGKLAADRLSPLRRLTMHIAGLAGDWRPWQDIDAWACSIAGELGRAEWFRRLAEETAGAPTELRRQS